MRTHMAYGNRNYVIRSTPFFAAPAKRALQYVNYFITVSYDV